MKKHIIIGALILTIATSMAAGTFATYTKTLSPITGSVATKSFYIGNNETYFPDIELAPSEKTEWDFEVVNFNANGTVNAVDTDMTVSLNVAAEAGKQPIDGLNVSIFDENNNQVGSTVIKNGQMSFGHGFVGGGLGGGSAARPAHIYVLLVRTSAARASVDSLDIVGDCGITPTRRIWETSRERANRGPVAGGFLEACYGRSSGASER